MVVKAFTELYDAKQILDVKAIIFFFFTWQKDESWVFQELDHKFSCPN